MRNSKIFIILFVFLLRNITLFSAWQVSANIVLEDTDLKGDVSLGVRSDGELMKKFYLDKAVFHVGYRTNSGFFFNVTPAFREEKLEGNKSFKQSMGHFVPLLLNQTLTKIKNTQVEWAQEFEQDLNILTEKLYTDDDIDIVRIESSAMNIIAAYHENLITRTDMVTMYTIVQKALEKVIAAHDEQENLVKGPVRVLNNKDSVKVLRFYDTLQAARQQKLENKKKLLAEKVKKLEELRDIIKTYC